MRIFLSYASQDRGVARSIERNLTEQGHDVFFDRDDLPPGEEYHARILRAIEGSDLFVILLSPDAVDRGSYTLSEMEIAERAYKRASGRILPVLLRPTPSESVPHFVRSVTYLRTTGNVAASVASAVHGMERSRRRRAFAGAGAAMALLAILAAGAWIYVQREVPSEITGMDGAPAVLIPAGGFVMGDDEESPRREVQVDAFYIDRFEVTTGRYARFLDAHAGSVPPEQWETLSLPAGAELPVVGVDWHEANAYCAWAERRLPTEAEWEKAARGTDERRYPWGNESPNLDRANYENYSPTAYGGGLAPVGAHQAGDSPYGVSDLVGNAAEWVADWYSDRFAASATRNPMGPANGDRKVVRGAGRFDPAERLAATKRYYAPPEQRGEDIGFRCARDAG